MQFFVQSMKRVSLMRIQTDFSTAIINKFVYYIYKKKRKKKLLRYEICTRFIVFDMHNKKILVQCYTSE